LNNLARALAQPDATFAPRLARTISRRAFEKHARWDAAIVSWLRPASAWIVVVVLSIVFGALCFISLGLGERAYSEYEAIISDSEALTRGSGFIDSDEDLVRCLEQKQDRP